MANRFIALLRGINVGGKNKLPMKDLASIFDAAGASDVATYIQSGNVVFAASAKVAKSIPAKVTKAIAGRFGYDIPIVLRTATEWRKAVDANPLPLSADGKQPAVGFLADRPTVAAVKRLDPDRSPPDTFAVIGREIYLCCPNGVARTKLTNAYFDSRLGTTSTFRNWKTTLKLLELAEAPPAP